MKKAIVLGIAGLAVAVLFLIASGLTSKANPVVTPSITTIATQGRFQHIQMGKTSEDMLLDTETGRVFDFYNTTILREVPTEVCGDAKCSTWKRVSDARQSAFPKRSD